MSKIVAVKGTGERKVKPNLVSVYVNIKSLNKNYNKSIEENAKKINKMVEKIKSLGINSESVKTRYAEITRKFEKYNDTGKFYGYECENSIHIEIDYNVDLLNKLLNAISNDEIKPNIDIIFTLKDEDREKIKEELLIEATKDAKKRAIILAAASNKKLGDIVRIDHEWSGLNFASDTRYSCKLRGIADDDRFGGFGGWNFNSEIMTPKEIDLTTSASFIWLME